MEKYAFIVALFCAAAVASPFTTKQYRSDYVYNRKTDAFYKLHTESQMTSRAQQKCTMEGASLMLPSSTEDVKQLHTMFKQFPDLGDVVIVATDRLPHDSLEETAIIPMEEDRLIINECEAVTRSGDIVRVVCWRQAPFICKVDARDAPYDEQCDVFDRDYVNKISVTGSCYKIPPVASSWNEAYAECEAKGGHLVVLNSEGEHEVVWDLIKSSPAVPGARADFFFFAGIRANRTKNGAPRVFRTVLNQSLEEAGYAKWSENEPNNYQDSEYCGSLFKNDGKYNDLTCSHKFAYICERERAVV